MAKFFDSLARKMFTGAEITENIARLGVSHVIWLPDSVLGTWEEALEMSHQFRLIRVCREGEAWPLAAGLHLGGKTPLVMMQTTGFFESGDAMRNVLFDLKLPIFALIGARSWLLEDSRDSAKQFVQPLLEAWGLAYRIIATPADKPIFNEHYQQCLGAGKAGVVLLAEGRS